MYSVVVPEDATERAQVFFDDSSDSSMFAPSLGRYLYTELMAFSFRTKSSHTVNSMAAGASRLVLLVDPSLLP